MKPTLPTLLGDLKRETKSLYKFLEAQTERINGLHHATTGKASEILAAEVRATLELALHREGKLLRSETNEIVSRIDNINWQIRDLCSLSLNKELDAVKITEALKREAK